MTEPGRKHSSRESGALPFVILSRVNEVVFFHPVLSLVCMCLACMQRSNLLKLGNG